MLSAAAVDFSLGLVIHHWSRCLSKKATLIQAFYDEKPGSNSTFTKKMTKSANSYLIQISLAQFPQSVYDMGKSGPAQNGIWENVTLWEGV